MKYKEFEINTTWHDNGYGDHDIQQIFPGKQPLCPDTYTHVIEKQAYLDACTLIYELEKNLKHDGWCFQQRPKGYCVCDHSNLLNKINAFKGTKNG